VLLSTDICHSPDIIVVRKLKESLILSSGCKAQQMVTRDNSGRIPGVSSSCDILVVSGVDCRPITSQSREGGGIKSPTTAGIWRIFGVSTPNCAPSIFSFDDRDKEDCVPAWYVNLSGVVIRPDKSSHKHRWC